MQAIAPQVDRYRKPGELVDSALADDVEHWRIVYRELLTMTDALLNGLPATAAASPQGCRLRARREELARCHEHWTQRSRSSRIS